jgi:hypothetical protein
MASASRSGEGSLAFILDKVWTYGVEPLSTFQIHMQATTLALTAKSAGVSGMLQLADVRSVRVRRSCADAVHNHIVRSDATASKVSAYGPVVDRRHVHRRGSGHSSPETHPTEHGICVITGPEELYRLNVLLYRKKLSLIAQIHSHPRWAASRW